MSPVENLAALYDHFIVPAYARFDLDIVCGRGARLRDAAGREYLDFGSGIAVCALGHCHPAVTEALVRQAATLLHCSNLYRSRPQAVLAQRLVEITGPGKVFFCNSGAEANEGLFKLARRAGAATGRWEMVTFYQSFHGRTLAAVAATGQQKVKEGFEPLPAGFRHAVFNDLGSVEGALTEHTAAILVEPIQGEGGIHVATSEFLRGLRRLCDERGMLLLFDEVQCGLGRAGAWCAWRQIAPEVQPDAVSWAKGIANGVPLGAFWISNRAWNGAPLCDALGPGSHGTTYGGNPLACAAALAVLETIEKENLCARARARGSLLKKALEEATGLEVRGHGLMLGLALPPHLQARDVVAALQRRGLLTIPAGTSIVRFLPPLTITEEEIAEAADIVRDAFAFDFS